MSESSLPPRRREEVKLTVLGKVQSKSQTVLLSASASERVIGRAVGEAVERVVPRVLERLPERVAPVVTLGQVAAMLGVTPRTVTERYVKAGLPCCRPGGKRQPPVFVLEDVVGWLRERSG